MSIGPSCTLCVAGVFYSLTNTSKLLPGKLIMPMNSIRIFLATPLLCPMTSHAGNLYPGPGDLTTTFTVSGSGQPPYHPMKASPNTSLKKQIPRSLSELAKVLWKIQRPSKVTV